MEHDEALKLLEKCWLFDCCKFRTGACYGLPDEGCPLYRWFKDLIEAKTKFISSFSEKEDV